jgi:hypothetical protein
VCDQGLSSRKKTCGFSGGGPPASDNVGGIRAAGAGDPIHFSDEFIGPLKRQGIMISRMQVSSPSRCAFAEEVDDVLRMTVGVNDKAYLVNRQPTGFVAG